MNWKTGAIITGLALAGGLVAGWIDFHSVEVQPTLLVLAMLNAILGYWQPRWFWLAAILSVVAVLLESLALGGLGLHPAAAPEPGPYAVLIAVIPVLAIGGVAALLRVGLRRL